MLLLHELAQTGSRAAAAESDVDQVKLFGAGGRAWWKWPSWRSYQVHSLGDQAGAAGRRV